MLCHGNIFYSIRKDRQSHRQILMIDDQNLTVLDFLDTVEQGEFGGVSRKITESSEASDSNALSRLGMKSSESKVFMGFPLDFQVSGAAHQL